MSQSTISSFYQVTNTNTNTDATITTTSTTTAMVDDSTSFLLDRLKSMSDCLPRVDDDDGFPFTSKEGQRGKQSLKSRQNMNSERDLHQFFKEHNLQHRPLRIFGDPRTCAASRRVGPFWTQETMLQAAMEFCIPAGLKVCFVCPELWDRDLLHQHDKFKKGSGGIMVSCPRCQTNQFMRQLGWTVSRSQNVQRTINKEMTHDIVIGATYECRNPSRCVRTTNKRKSFRSYTVYTSEFWAQYPDIVRRRYLDYTSGVDERSTIAMLSPGLLDKLLFYSGSFEDFSTELTDSIQHVARTLETH